MTSAGVLVRQFDSLSDPTHPWLPCPEDWWCAAYHDVWPASIISAQVRNLYFTMGKGGLVLAPTVRFNCVYPGDGNSMGNVDSGNGGCSPDQCDRYGPRDWNCIFPPDQLMEALQAQQRRGKNHEHNELVIDTSSVTSGLPGTILAFFHMGDEHDVRQVQQSFVRYYGLQDHECPLLALDLHGDPPFITA